MTYAHLSLARRLFQILPAVVALAGGCDASDQEVSELTAGADAGGKADSIDGFTSVVLAQAGAFGEFGMNVPQLLHYGFADEAHPGWEGVGDIEIAFDADHRSLPVVVEVPTDVEADLLAFVIQSQTRNGIRWGQDQFIPLDEPAGTMIRMPVSNGAGYPFSPECYGISVGGAHYDGRIQHIWYGFTPASQDEYFADNNVAWFDVLGDPGAYVVGAEHQHDGGFKGSMVMLDPYVRVPEGMNLAFKLNIDKFGGSCLTDNDTHFLENTETQTYFAPVE